MQRPGLRGEPGSLSPPGVEEMGVGKEDPGYLMGSSALKP